jgi:hypothetical protein
MCRYAYTLSSTSQQLHALIKSNRIKSNQICGVVEAISSIHLGRGALASMVMATSSFADTPEPYKRYHFLEFGR